MFQTKKSILLLPLASLGIYAHALGFAFLAAGSFNWYGGDIFRYVLGLFIFCCICSVANGTFAVVRRADRFPKLARFVNTPLILSVFVLFIGIFVFMSSLSTDIIVEGLVLLAAIFLCFTSFFVTLFVIIREAIRKAQNFHTWIIFVTQLLWISFAFVSLMLLAAISAAC